MTFKQLCKIISLIFTILATVSLFLPNAYYQNRNYNTFNLVNADEFRFFVLLLILLVIGSLISNLASISYDSNKIIPLATLGLALVGAILASIIKVIAAPDGKISYEMWMHDANLKVGAILMIISLYLSFILNAIISFRSFVLKKNDDEYLNASDEEVIEEVEEEKVDLGDDVDMSILEQFKKKD